MEITSPSAAAFEVLFDLLPTYAVLLAPVYDATHVLVDFTFHAVNPAAQQMLGLPTRPTVTLLQHMPQHGPTGLFERYCQAFASGERTQFTLPYQGEGFDSYYQLVAQRAGELLVVHYLDLTTLRTEAAQQELRASRAREQAAQQERARQQQLLEAVFEQAPAGVWVVKGPDYVFELFNPQMGQILGRSSAQALGRPYFEVMPELVSQGLPELFRRVWEQGEPVYVEELAARLAYHAPGQVGYFTFVFQPLRDGHGHVTRISCVALDVSTQVLARQRSEASERRLRLLTDALPVLISYIDRERRYQFVNEAYRAWFRQDAAALLGQRVHEVVGEPAYATVVPYLDRGLAGERVDFETVMPYRADFTRHIQANFIPDVQAGEVLGLFTLVTDITEQVAARQQVEALNQELAVRNSELHDTNAQLTRANTDLDSFVYTASHDLKAPITNLEGLLTALGEELPAPVVAAPATAYLLQLMREALGRFQHTLRHLTTFTHLVAGDVAEPEVVNVAALVEGVRLDLAAGFAAAQAELRVDIAECPQVRFSPKKLRSIVFNLLSNALKYRAPARAPRILVRARCQNRQLTLVVQDNGLGLSPQQQGDLFQLFRRLHPQVDGTGIGLYSIKRLIDNAQGTITVESTVDVGSTFTVTLPLEVG